MSSTARRSPRHPYRGRSELGRDAHALREVGGPVLLWILLLLRLPQVMAPLGVLTWVASITGSVWTAAMSAAAMCAGSAVCGMVVVMFARVTWRQWGLLVLAVAQGVAMWLLPGVPLTPVPLSLGNVSAFLPFLAVGLSLAPMGLACRVRWSSLVRHAGRTDLFPAAMRQESVSEALAVLGGAGLTGLLAFATGEESVLRCSALLSVGMCVLFLVHPSARVKQVVPEAPVHDGADHEAQARRWSALRLRRQLTMGSTGLGALLGAIQGCLVVYAVSLDTAASLGALYAVLGLAAAIAAVLVLRSAPRSRPWNLWVLYATATLLASMMLSVPSGVLGFTVVLGLMGLCAGPSLISSFGLVGHVAPGGMFMGQISRMSSAIAVGTALGLVLSAYLGVRYSYISAALVPVVMAIFHMACALMFMYSWRRSTLSRTYPAD